MKKKIAALLVLCMVSVLAFSACGKSTDTASDPELSRITTDAENKTVTINAYINGRYFNKSTHHYIVFEGGSTAKDSMIIAYCDSQDFHQALVDIGGKSWNETADELKDGEFTDGQKIDVSLTWEGHEEPVTAADTLKLADGSRPGMDVRFSGNKENNARIGTGCILCLDSCWGGITSNAAYGFNSIASAEPEIFFDEEAVPGDGTQVQITFALK